MQPWELIKMVREIEHVAYAEPETVQQNEIKQTAAVDLSKRLKDFRAINDAASLKVNLKSRVTPSHPFIGCMGRNDSKVLIETMHDPLNNFSFAINALEEWRKRKMERARLRELKRNGTSAT